MYFFLSSSLFFNKFDFFIFLYRQLCLKVIYCVCKNIFRLKLDVMQRNNVLNLAVAQALGDYRIEDMPIKKLVEEVIFPRLMGLPGQ